MLTGKNKEKFNIRRLSQKETKLIHQLFIVKVSDILGVDKTLELIRECKKEILTQTNKN